MESSAGCGGTVLELEHPWALLALPLPYLVYRVIPPHTERVEALRVPFIARIAELSSVSPREGANVRRRGLWRVASLVLIWLSTVIALAKPTLRGEPITVTRSARDLQLAVDLSGSMDTRDLTDASGAPASRLAVVKEVVGDFVARRKGDRIGLMVFGAAPYVQVPFTLDTSLVTRLLGETETRMAGDSTRLGDAIGLAIQVFQRSEVSDLVLVLLTDGNDTGSEVPPLTAAHIAAERHITIHVVGVGDPTLAGEQRLNEDVLSEIARRTGGQYFHAADRRQLSSIYAALDQLEAITFESSTYTPRRLVYHYPLALGLLVSSTLSLWLALSAPRRRPRMVA
jgi:Ca-activated chloride channel family protein